MEFGASRACRMSSWNAWTLLKLQNIEALIIGIELWVYYTKKLDEKPKKLVLCIPTPALSALILILIRPDEEGSCALHPKPLLGGPGGLVSRL